MATRSQQSLHSSSSLESESKKAKVIFDYKVRPRRKNDRAGATTEAAEAMILPISSSETLRTWEQL